MRVAYVVIAALLIGAPAAAQDVKAGISAWAKSDYLGAINIWRPLAARGEPDAMFNLAQAYRLGKGVAVDLPEALSLYSRAANAGHVDAQTQLGILLFQNGNQLSGLRWLQAAADSGEPRAQLLYGTALFNGDGLVKRDPEAAYRYVARSAAQGLSPAKATLADMDKIIPADLRARAVAGIGAFPARPAPAKSKALPSPKPTVAIVAPKPAPPPAAGGWRIQLGAFGQRGGAEALFRKLAAGSLAGRQPYYIPVGAVTRLQAGPYPSKAAASAACAALAGRGQACFVVAAR